MRRNWNDIDSRSHKGLVSGEDCPRKCRADEDPDANRALARHDKKEDDDEGSLEGCTGDSVEIAGDISNEGRVESIGGRGGGTNSGATGRSAALSVRPLELRQAKKLGAEPPQREDACGTTDDAIGAVAVGSEPRRAARNARKCCAAEVVSDDMAVKLGTERKIQPRAAEEYSTAER